MQLKVAKKEIHGPFLTGGGEMGDLTRNFHWSVTPIGSPQFWPASLRTMVNMLLHSPHPMLLLWGEDLIQFYNDAFRPSFGINGKHPEALGQKAIECWPEIWDTINPMIEQVFEGKSTWSEDQLIPVYRNGHIEDAYWTFGYSPVVNENGKIAGVLIVCTETTEKANSSKKLFEQSEELNFAIEASELATWDLNPFTQRLAGNDRLKEWFGLCPHEDIKLEIAINTIAQKDRQRVLESIYYTMTFESGGHYDIVYTIVHPKTLQPRLVHARGKVIFNENKIAVRFSGILQDMTAPKNSEDRIQQTSARLELALEAGKLGSYEYFANTGEILCNEQFKLNFGLDPNSTVSMTEVGAIIIPEDREGVQKAVDRAFAGHRLLNIEYRIMLPDGSLRWIRACGKGVYDENDNPVKMIGITADVSEEKQSSGNLEKVVQERTAELENKNKELERSNASLEEFTHIASHDLKEPMRKIHFFSDRLKSLLADRMTEDESVTFTRIENANKRMISLIDDLLMYSRISLRPPQMEKVDLNEKISKIMEDFDVDIQQKRVLMTVSNMPVVRGYPVHLQQLFQNLIGNALKYHRPGVPPKINISCTTVRANPQEIPGLSANSDYYLIKVRDNGIGFDQSQSERIFQMFQRLHGNAEYRGTGVGLAIARKVADNHHGAIVAQSLPGEGSVFSVYLPA